MVCGTTADYSLNRPAAYCDIRQKLSLFVRRSPQAGVGDRACRDLV